MFDYAALEAIAAVLREGSFERAARRLHVTPSAISQRIKQLEERMGQVLVLRGSPCTGTDAGRQLCLHFEQVALLENSLRRNHPGLHDGQVTTSPTLQLAVNADSLSTWFMDAVAAFADAGNELLDLRIDDQDHTAQRLRDGLDAMVLDRKGLAAVPALVERGLVTTGDERLFLTRRGRLLADAVVRELVSRAPSGPVHSAVTKSISSSTRPSSSAGTSIRAGALQLCPVLVIISCTP